MKASAKTMQASINVLSKVADHFEAKPHTYNFGIGYVPKNPNEAACVLAYLGYYTDAYSRHCDDVSEEKLGIAAKYFYNQMDQACKEVLGEEKAYVDVPSFCNCSTCRRYKSHKTIAWKEDSEACVKTIRRYVEKYAEAA